MGSGQGVMEIAIKNTGSIFIIVCAPRTGSTLLVRTLQQICGITCHGELLLGQRVRDYRDSFNVLQAPTEQRAARAERLLQERAADPRKFIDIALHTEAAATGMKVIYEDFLDPRWSDAISWLTQVPGIKFIHLKRRNTLRRYVSEQAMHLGGPIHSGLGGRGKSKVKVTVDPEAFLRRTDEIHREAAQVEELLERNSVLDIWYEDLASDTSATVTRLCQFIGVDVGDTEIQPALRKVGAKDLRDSVANFDELLDNDSTRQLALAD